MSRNRAKSRRARVKFALVAVGLALGLAAAAFALSESGLGPKSGTQDDAPRATKSSRGLSIRATPLSKSVVPGESASYALRIRSSRRRKVRLSVVSGLPSGAGAWFSPRTTRKTASLTISTAGAPSGGHRIGLLARRGRHRATAAVDLVITSPGSGNVSFNISGDLSGELVPGATQPLDLAVTNPGPSKILITQLAVSIDEIEAPRADGAHPCTLEDFSVTQFSGAYHFEIGPGETRTLSELGFTEAQRPQVTMLDRPVNQNGCKDASLTFTYSGASRGEQ